MVYDLLVPKWLTLRNAPSSDRREKGKVVLFALFGLMIWVVIYLGSDWFLGRCLAVEPIGELLVEKLLDLTLLVVFSVLLFSNIINAFSTFYLSEDLQLLMSHPIPPNSLYTARLVETCVLSGWMPTLFALPVFIAAGVLFGAGLGYYLAVVVGLVLMVVISAELAVPLTLALTNIMPAHRTRDMLVFLGVVVVVVLFILLRAINPEEMFQPDQFDSTMELFASLQNPSSSLLPSSWTLAVLRPLLRSESDQVSWLHAGALASTAGALYFIGAWSFRRWHGLSYSKAQEGRHGGGGLEQVAGWMRGEQASGAQALERSLEALRSRTGPLNPVREMMLKDARVFVRDTAQWSQMVLLVALIVIYLMNFRYFRTLGEGGIIGPVGLYIMNVLLCGFVAAAIGVRFLFPAVSLEGRSFWLLRCAPQTMRQFLFAKWVTGMLPLLALSELLTIASNMLIGTPWPMIVFAAVVIGSLTLGLSGLGIGLGAIYPRFHLDNAAKIATGFGGMLYMILALMLVLLTAFLVAAPAWVGFLYAKDQTFYLDAGSTRYAVVGTLGLLLIPAIVGRIALGLGTRSLSEGR
ncbi:MAG: hypothetical protein AAFX99_16875 [Myxococcota bacterium]